MTGNAKPSEQYTNVENEQLRFALAAAGIGTWDLDPIHREVHWDARCKSLYGFSKDDVVPYEQVLQCMHPNDRDRVHQAVQSALSPQSGTNYDIEFRTVGAEDGQMRWLRCQGKAYFNEQGVAYRFSGIAQDVTNDVLIARQMSENEARFRSLVEEAPVATCLFVGRDLVIEVANQAILDIWGKGDAVLGKPLADALPELEGQPFLKILDDIYTSGQPYQATAAPCDLVVDGKLGRYYFDFTYKPLRNAAGEVYAIMDMAVDVTDRVKAQQKIQESEAYFRQLTDTGPAIIWMTEPDGYCTYLNRQWYAYTGQTQAEAEGYGWLNATHSDDRAEAGRQFLAANHQQISFSLLYRLYHHNGTYRWAIDQGSPRFSPDGTYEGMIGTVIDVHEQIISRQQLAERENLFKNVTSSAPTGLWLSDEAGGLTYLNKTLVDWTGLPYDDLLGVGWANAIIEEDRQRSAETFLKAVNTRTHYDVLFRINKADGSIIWCQAVGDPYYDDDGTYAGYAGFCMDIDELITGRQKLIESETSLLGAIELAQLATWRMDIPTGMFHYSARFMNWLGFSKDTKSMDEAYNPLPDEYRQSVPEAIAEAIRPGSSGFYENEHPIVNRLTGQIRIIHAQAQVFYDAEGNPAVLSGTALDVTEQRKIQLALERQVQERTEELESTNEELAATNEELMATNEELTESTQQLVRSNDNLQRFAYVASHDLQEPLRKVQQFGDLLKTQYADGLGEGVDYLERMQAAASRMSTLIRDLLSFSRISTQRDTNVPVPLSDVVQAALLNLEVGIQETGADIEVAVLPTIEGDALQLGQLFQNLLGNALKFRKSDVKPRIRVSAQLIAADNLPAAVRPAQSVPMYHRIDVADNGIGFDNRYIDRIFQVFQRLHGKNQYAGTGIGLAICEKVAANHGGAITATSQLGQGATFSVYLPA